MNNFFGHWGNLNVERMLDDSGELLLIFLDVIIAMW